VKLSFGRAAFWILAVPAVIWARTSDLQSPLDSAVLESSSTSAPDSTPPVTLHQKLGLYLLSNQNPWEASFEGGAEMLRVKSNTVVAPAFGLRVGAAASAWSGEIGGALSTDTPGNFAQVSDVVNNTLDTAETNAVYEIHITGNYELPHGQQTWIAPDVGFGVSLLHFSDEIHTYALPYLTEQTFEPVRFSFSPLFRVGITFFPPSARLAKGGPKTILSLRVDAAYVGYANTVTGASQTFDLGTSGFVVRGMLQMRL
jgi:hypothetical protein